MRFGRRPLTQFDWIALYPQARDAALTPSNIKAGFRATGVFPLMSGNDWLAKYGDQHGYVGESEVFQQPTCSKPQADIAQFLQPSKLIEALDLVTAKPRSMLAIPKPIKKINRKPRQTLDGLPLAAAKVLNRPSRTSKLTELEKQREIAFNRLAKERAQREEKRKLTQIQNEKKAKAKALFMKNTEHIMKELVSKYGEGTKFSIVKVRDLLMAKGVTKKDAKTVKKATVVSQWEKLLQKVEKNQ